MPRFGLPLLYRDTLRQLGGCRERARIDSLKGLHSRGLVAIAGDNGETISQFTVLRQRIECPAAWVVGAQTYSKTSRYCMSLLLLEIAVVQAGLGRMMSLGRESSGRTNACASTQKLG